MKCQNYLKGFGVFHAMPKKNKLNPQAIMQQAQTEVFPATQTKKELKPSEQETQGNTVERWQELFRFLNFRVMELKEEQTRTQPMLPETKKLVFEGWLELLKFLGLPALPSAREKLLEMLKTGHTPEDLASGGMMVGMLAAFALVMDRHLENSEEPTPAELKKTLAGFKEFRYQMRPIFKDSTAKLLKTMPHDPGGHPRRFKTEKERAQVCHEVAALHEKGIPKSEAFRKLARKYKTSWRTIQREWRKRPKQTA